MRSCGWKSGAVRASWMRVALLLLFLPVLGVAQAQDAPQSRDLKPVQKNGGQGHPSKCVSLVCKGFF